MTDLETAQTSGHCFTYIAKGWGGHLKLFIIHMNDSRVFKSKGLFQNNRIYEVESLTNIHTSIFLSVGAELWAAPGGRLYKVPAWSLLLHPGHILSQVHSTPPDICIYFTTASSTVHSYTLWLSIKGGDAKTRAPETFKCSKSKTSKARKLKVHQPVYLIR